MSDAIWVLVERLAATGVVDDPEALRARIAEARGEDLVAQSGRAFIAHYRTESAQELGIAIGIAPEPIARDVGRGRCARAVARALIVVLLAPPRMAGRYLQALGAFSRVLSRPVVVDHILAVRHGRRAARASLPARGRAGAAALGARAHDGDAALDARRHAAARRRARHGAFGDRRAAR